MAKQSFEDKVQALLLENGRMTVRQIAHILYPSEESNRSPNQGGPTGAMFAVSGHTTRCGFKKRWDKRENQWFVYPKSTK